MEKKMFVAMVMVLLALFACVSCGTSDDCDCADCISNLEIKNFYYFKTNNLAHFVAEVNGTGTTNFFIDFGDGVTEESEIVCDERLEVDRRHTYANIGTYTVTASLLDDQGYTNQAYTLEVTIEKIAEETQIETVTVDQTDNTVYFTTLINNLAGTVHYTIDYGDGVQEGQDLCCAGDTNVVTDHTYDASGSYLVQAWLGNEQESAFAFWVEMP